MHPSSTEKTINQEKNRSHNQNIFNSNYSKHLDHVDHSQLLRPTKQRIRSLLSRHLGPFPRIRHRCTHHFYLDKDIAPFVNARIDWKETPEAHIFKADLPGLTKEEVKVELEEGNVLQIRGERSQEIEEKTDQWHRVERSSGKFLRRFRLPENAKVDEVKASMENGVLTVNVPKGQVTKPDVKAIDISG